MKNRLFYPAVFHKAEEGGFWVSFPDFPECMTQGDSMDEAYELISQKHQNLKRWILKMGFW